MNSRIEEIQFMNEFGLMIELIKWPEMKFKYYNSIYLVDCNKNIETKCEL